MIVVDTNLISYLMLPGEYQAIAQQIYQQQKDWRVPFLWRSEFRNVLAGYVRRKLITLDQAKEMMDIAEGLVRGHEYLVPSERVLDLVQLSNCSAYDCEFVALAQQLRTSLVTADRKVLAAFPHTAVTPQQFLG